MPTPSLEELAHRAMLIRLDIDAYVAEQQAREPGGKERVALSRRPQAVIRAVIDELKIDVFHVITGGTARQGMNTRDLYANLARMERNKNTRSEIGPFLPDDQWAFLFATMRKQIARDAIDALRRDLEKEGKRFINRTVPERLQTIILCSEEPPSESQAA